MFSLLLICYFILFAYLTVRRLLYGLILIAAFLPSYLIRFQILGLPGTVLEGLILITVLVWIIKHGRDWPALAQNFFKLKPLPPPFNQWFLATILLFIAATFSIFVSPNLRAALGIWKAYFVEPILLLAVFISTVQRREDVNKIIWGLTLGALAVSIFAIIQKFTGWLIPNLFWQAESTRRVTSFFGYPNAVALYLAPIAPLIIHLLISKIKEQRARSKEQSKNCASFIVFCFLFFVLCSLFLAIVFAHSTGALAALAATAVLFGLFNKKTRWWTVGLMVAAMILIPLSPLKDPFQQEVILGGRSGLVRLNMWAETIEMLKARPIWGAGLAGYQAAVQPYHILPWAEIYLYPHNLFLNFWSETGLLGLAAFCWLVILFCRKAINRLSSRDWLAPALLASMAVILIHGLVDAPYFKNDLSVIFWLLTAMMVVETRQRNISAKTDIPSRP